MISDNDNGLFGCDYRPVTSVTHRSEIAKGIASRAHLKCSFQFVNRCPRFAPVSSPLTWNNSLKTDNYSLNNNFKQWIALAPEGALRSKRGNDLKKTAVKAKGTTLCVFRLGSADNPAQRLTSTPNGG